ncbi:putative RNase III [Tieghemostelium lacteum]|uniref:Putative RNase III n=1 Tax=Tieghemostelium lacteum TaxID=361077 RepID=A0A152A9J5_TIELA|nr:putative RNase III [Tieghemostelium lacteum]|eukprot:KYR02801.1 putative RNase III [Tieghemostelium lacteum]
MDITFSPPKSPKPTREQLFVKSPNHDCILENQRELNAIQNHQEYVHEKAEKGFFDYQNARDKNKKVKDERNEEHVEREMEYENEMERAGKNREKYLDTIKQKGMTDVEHSKEVVEKLKSDKEQFPQH